VKRDPFIRAAIVIGAVLLLEALCRSGAIKSSVMIPPSAMAVALVGILRTGKFDQAIVITLGNVALAALIASIAGVCVGAIIHSFPRVRRAIDPLLTSYYAIPTFLFYPILIVFLGVGRVAITGLAVMMGTVIMIVSTLSGLDNIPPILMRTARIYRMGWWSRARLIQAPAAAPFLVSGLKLVVAYAFIGVIAAEFIMSGDGLGYSIADAYNEFDNKTMYALMLLVILVVTIVNGTLHVWDQRIVARRSR
jgi:NitT/TauT family transport system permease protein